MNRRELLAASIPIFLATTPFGTRAAVQARPIGAPLAVDAKIELVWPHPLPTGRPGVNVEVYLYQFGTQIPVGCDFTNTVRLRWALNESYTNDLTAYQTSGALLPTSIAVPGYELPAEAIGQMQTRTVDGVTFPYWLFEDVPVATGIAQAKSVLESTYFVASVDGVSYRTNVWAHSPDPRTRLPNQLVPQIVATTPRSEVDAMIQAVYPHNATGDLRSVTLAPLVNVAVDLFAHPIPFAFPGGPIPAAVGTDLGKSVWLLRSLNDGYLERVKPADQTLAMRGDVTWPRYVFNDVDVSATLDPANKYYFAVLVDGVTTHTSIWAHGADARTDFPQRDRPQASSTSCT